MFNSHPAFIALVAAEKARASMRRRPGGRAALAANSALCMRLEAEVMRATGATFQQISGAALAAARKAT